MTRIFSAFFKLIMALWSRFFGIGQRVGWTKIGIAALGILIGITAARFFIGRNSSDTVTETNIPEVTVSSVADLTNQASPLSLVGVVQSLSQATIHAESSGPVTAVYHSLGDYVPAGAVIAELEDSSQRAALTQAQAGVAAAQAALNKIGVGGQSTKSSAVNALLSAYASVDSAVRSTADTMILNPTGSSPQFVVSSANSQLVTSINGTRPSLTAMLSREASKADSISASDDLSQELATTIAEVRTTYTFIDNIVKALNAGIPSQTVSQTTINGYIAAVTGARASLNGTLSALTAAQAAYTTSQQPDQSGSSPDIATGQAGLLQAQGALAAARANLEKSIIRAPISGTINSISIKQGDFVQQFSPVVTVANNGALEIVAYLSQQDTVSNAVGDKVTILEDGSTGVITHIAPALDPVTKKIEVRIGVPNSDSLVNGQSVTITLPHRTTTTTSKPNSKISIPISAIKVGAQEVDVFTVASSTLVAHPVTLGELLGDRVVISSGLTPDMTIVTDARGLRDGETVTVH